MTASVRLVREALVAAKTGNADYDVVPEEYQHFPAVALGFAAEALAASGVNPALIAACHREVAVQPAQQNRVDRER